MKNRLLKIFKNGDKKRVKFLKPIHNLGEKTNGLTTLELRRDLIYALANRFPKYKEPIMREWNIYKQRKERTPFKMER